MDKECKHNNIQVNPNLDTVWRLDDSYNIVCASCKLMIIEDVSEEKAISIIKDIAYRSE